MPRVYRSSRIAGFTLIEMMITVAIVGILASFAIPNFQRYQWRSRRSESMSNLKAIGKMEAAYFGENGVFTPVLAQPAGAPAPFKRVWDAASEVAFSTLGFGIEGSVFYSYDIDDGTLGGCCGASTCFTASAYGDLDGDGGIAVIAYFHPSAGGAVCPTLIGVNPAPLDAMGNPVYDRPIVLPTSPGSDDY